MATPTIKNRTQTGFANPRPQALIASSFLVFVSGLLVSAPAQQAPNFFRSADQNSDAYITNAEFRAATATWITRAVATQSQLANVLDTAFPEPEIASMLAGRGPQNQTPKADDVANMMAA